jgi:hypothetical protein
MVCFLFLKFSRWLWNVYVSFTVLYFKIISKLNLFFCIITLTIYSTYLVTVISVVVNVVESSQQATAALRLYFVEHSQIPATITPLTIRKICLSSFVSYVFTVPVRHKR